ncbi:hypothetical protein BOSP111201_22415 [Bordetella sputigena]
MASIESPRLFAGPRRPAGAGASGVVGDRQARSRDGRAPGEAVSVMPGRGAHWRLPGTDLDRPQGRPLWHETHALNSPCFRKLV